MADTLINRVANSGIITLNLEDHFPEKEIATFDLKDYLFMEMILKEKDFRSALKTLDWTAYDGKIVVVHCSVDAIIPMWAYMLVGSYLEGVADTTYQGTASEYLAQHYTGVIDGLAIGQYTDKMIVIKGCGEKPVPPQAYLALTQRLKSVAKSIMYGEPCSTVPIYKKPKNR